MGFGVFINDHGGRIMTWNPPPSLDYSRASHLGAFKRAHKRNLKGLLTVRDAQERRDMERKWCLWQEAEE